MNKNNPLELIRLSPMGSLQVFIVVLTVMLNALDGLDVVAITLASNPIYTEYGIDKLILGVVLSMELIGMAAGSIFLGGVADQFGRRPTILGCLVVMCLGMFMATTEPGIMAQGLQHAAGWVGWLQDTPPGIVHLLIWRFITGLGIGGMLAAINAVVAEYSSGHRKHMNVSIMAMGYPIGAAVGSQIASYLLIDHSWRSVFYMGFIFAAILIPLVFFFMPETVHWLEKKRPANALNRINSTMGRMGLAPVSELLPPKQLERKETVIDIFSPLLIGITIVLTIAYFFHIMTFYFVLKWVGQIIADMGFSNSAIGQMVFWVSVGGATGGGVIGLLTLKFDLRKLTIGAMLLSVVMVNIFGRSPASFSALAAICFGAGFCTNAAINGMYAIFAHAYPTHVRAVGTGFAIGVGRGGSVLAPIIAGYLFNNGVSVPIVATVMALGSLCAAIALFFLKYRPEPPEVLEAEEATGIALLHESAA